MNKELLTFHAYILIYITSLIYDKSTYTSMRIGNIGDSGEALPRKSDDSSSISLPQTR